MEGTGGGGRGPDVEINPYLRIRKQRLNRFLFRLNRKKRMFSHEI